MVRKLGKAKSGSEKPANTENIEVEARLDKTLVATGGNVKTPSRFSKIQKNKNFKIGVIAVLVLVGLWVAYTVTRPEPKPVVKTPTCSDELLGRAVDKLDPQELSELEPIYKEIKQVPNYQQNPSCMYIELIYLINNGYGKESKEAYEKLKKVYDPKVGYRSPVQKYAMPMKNLEMIVNGLVEQSSNVKLQKSSKVEAPQ